MNTVALALAAVLMAGALLVYPPPMAAARPSFTVLQWNVLARQCTHYNAGPPNCEQRHLNPEDRLETIAQPRQRYELAAIAIASAQADAVLLQEVEPEFFTEELNPSAQQLLGDYHVFPTYGPEGAPG